MQTFFLIIMTAYGLLAMTHIVAQMMLAYVHQVRTRRLESPLCSAEDFKETVSIIYPVYNETPEVLRQVFEHAVNCLRLPNLDIVFIDDGSPNLHELRPIYDEFACKRIRIYYQKNGGKREAQYSGLSKVNGEFIVTVDSDTLIEPHAIQKLIAPLLRDPHLGAVCGEVGIENNRTNLLTRLISLRYWSAFNLERAAQSCFQSVLCCSGPFSVYRRAILEQVKEDYISQKFCGKQCTYGDDRHLTNLVLGQGFGVVYQPGAYSLTYCPETIGEYISQQTRWNKSFYREMLWTLKITKRVHPYAIIDMLMQPVLFLGFTLALSYCVLLLVTLLDMRVLVGYLVTLIVMATFRSIYGLLRTRDISFLLFVFYGFLHVFVLVPVRFKSLLTMTDSDWGTRSVKRTNPYLSFMKWGACYVLLLTTTAGLIGVLLPEMIATITTLRHAHKG